MTMSNDHNLPQVGLGVVKMAKTLLEVTSCAVTMTPNLHEVAQGVVKMARTCLGSLQAL